MDNFDLKNYLTENRINRRILNKNKNFSSDGYQIVSVEPTSLQGGRGFLPIQFADFPFDVRSNEYDSVSDFIQNSIYETFQDSIDSIYKLKEEAFTKELNKKIEKLEDDWNNEKISEEEYDIIQDEIDGERADFDAIEPHELVIIDMDDEGGHYEIFHPVTNMKLIDGEFNIF